MSKRREKAIVNGFKNLRLRFSGLREDVGNYIQSEIGVFLNEESSRFGYVRWISDHKNEKRVILDLYPTGKIVFELQTKLSTEEKTQLDTSRDFLDPEMKPKHDNYFNLYVDDQFIDLITEINNHFGN